jgi:predicted DsbA family dithiol-disulfide isomerase
MKPIMIEIWSDFACPYCYIGQQRLHRVIKSLGIKQQVVLVHKAYQLNPFAPETQEKSAYEVYAEKLGIPLEQAKDKLNTLALLAKEESIEMNYGLVKMTQTFDAHRLSKLSEEPLIIEALHQKLMKGYFKEGLNLAHPDVLIKLGLEVGFQYEQLETYLQSNSHEEAVRNDMLEAKSLGIRGVPYFLINRSYAISGAQPYETFKATLQKVINQP